MLFDIVVPTLNKVLSYLTIMPMKTVLVCDKTVIIDYLNNKLTDVHFYSGVKKKTVYRHNIEECILSCK